MLVVRVKRNRNDSAAESICVVEDANPNPSKKRSVIGRLADRISSIKTEDSKRVLLARVETLDCIEFPTKKLDNSGGEYIYLDMVHSQLDQSIAISLGASTHNSEQVTGLLNFSEVASKQLESAILIAMRTGDFNGISLALQQKADPNYQISIENGGFTSLMAAVTHCNLRMTKRLLLSRSIDVSARNKDGLTVLDIANKLTHNATSMKIKLLLQTVVNKLIDAQQRVDSTQSSTSQNENDFVVDIYTVQQTTTNTSHPTSTTTNTVTIPTVQVKGINISSSGDVTRVHTDYDSDWSDLGDDEGVDSDDEDERGENEQYLREKEEELNGKERDKKVRFETLTNDSGIGAAQQIHQNGNEQTTTVDSNTRGVEESKSNTATNTTTPSPPSDPRLPGRAVCSNLRTRFTVDTDSADQSTHCDNDNEDREPENDEINADSGLTLTGDVSDDSDGDDERLPRFDYSTGVGKVIRPYVLPDAKDTTQTVALHTVHDSESLRELWDEEGPVNEGGEDSASVDDPSHKDKNTRLKEMRARTGMLFGSNPREFYENGLPKYGAELSDDDCDVMTSYVEDGGEYLLEMARKEGYVRSDTTSEQGRVEEVDSNGDVIMDISSGGSGDSGQNVRSGSGNVMGAALSGNVRSNMRLGLTSLSNSRMPDRSAVAYDSELDNSDSD